MGVFAADTQGAIDKSVSVLMAADAQGAIDKVINKGFVAHVQGAIGKKFYENWVYHTGTILNSSSGGGDIYGSVSLTPGQLSYDIKPYRIQTSVWVTTVDVTATGTARLDARYLNESDNWVTIQSVSSNVTDSDTLMQLDFYVTEEIITRQMQYRLVHTGGEAISFSSFIGKCSAWYQRG